MMKKTSGILYLLCHGTKREYAERLLYQGILHFSSPKRWIDEAKKGNEGQGDLLEGVYTNILNAKTEKEREQVEIVPYKGASYYRSKEVVSKWLGFCFYAVSDVAPHKKDGDNLVFEMVKKYADDFCNKETIETMIGKELSKRRAMLIITDVRKFQNRIIAHFEKYGLEKDRDYLMYLVKYRLAGRKFFYSEEPHELFAKDGRFSYQNEYRILLNSASPNVQKMLDKGQEICLGSLEDCAALMSYFYNGSKITVSGDQIHVTTPQVMSAVGQMQDWGMMMLRLFMSAAYHTGSCMMDGREVSNMFFWGEVQTMLYRKYHIQVRQGLFNDGMDDHFEWYFLGDDYDTILRNEQKAIFYYTRKTDYKGPVLSTLYGGYPLGKVVITMFAKTKVGKKA